MKTKLKKLLSLILAIITIISTNVATNISAQAATTITDYHDVFNFAHRECTKSFKIKSKQKVKLTFKSEIKASVCVYFYDDDDCEDYIVFSNYFDSDDYVTSFTKTVTLPRGIYYVDFVTKNWNDKYQRDGFFHFSFNVQTVASTEIKTRTIIETCSVGKTFSLNPRLLPADEIAFKSSDSKIATVNKNGLVTAKDLGKCTITVKYSNGEKYNCTVIANSRKLYVFKGSSRTSPKINGKTNSNWKVDKESVASFKNQKFKGLSTGATAFTTKVNKAEYKTIFYVVDYNTMYKKGVSLIKDHLKDPNSFTVNHIYRGYDEDGNPTIVFDSSAKNSSGGMVRDYRNIWVEYNASKKKFVYHYYKTDYKISLTGEKKIK